MWKWVAVLMRLSGFKPSYFCRKNIIQYKWWTYSLCTISFCYIKILLNNSICASKLSIHLTLWFIMWSKWNRIFNLNEYCVLNMKSFSDESDDFNIERPSIYNALSNAHQTRQMSMEDINDEHANILFVFDAIAVHVYYLLCCEYTKMSD